MNCISCNFSHQEKFCPNCGEKNGVKKISFKSLSTDTLSSITNMDKGFLYNVKALTLQPRKIITDFIAGKRKGIFNPISFLILALTMYVIVLTFFSSQKEITATDHIYKSEIRQISEQVGLFIRTYLKYFWLFSIIPLAAALKLIFKTYNFMEHLAISSFIIGQATLIGIISFLVFRFPFIFDPIVYLVILGLVYQIFKIKNEKVESMLLSSAVLVLFFIQLAIIIVLIGVFKSLS